ncbi:MAG TPA: 1-deoxy-D-xylulose-5-phosphate synthase [Clostridiales bacterium]|nr:1-deoxy-D-xylulose-5-phosphate synthase [Clostridiales bacterium]
MSAVLSRINGPADLRLLTSQELEALATEIRETIVATVARNGGHLAPNLGVVELTLALHRVFDSPRDRIIFDVGHQTYVHKLVTGRRERFSTLRTYGGLAGFPRFAESPHDAFETGHASTSISAALGIAKARDLTGDSCRVVAVIGDGALTGGLALEALNHAGHAGTRLLVVLNDNELSYGPTVGGLAAHLTRARAHPTYARVRKRTLDFVRRFPSGESLAKLAERLKGSVKYLLVPGVLFEELGFRYFGPIDGHNLPGLEDTLRQVRDMPGPILLHVVTRKGKGYLPAEANPDRYHGIGPFDPATGEPANHGEDPTYTEVFGRTLLRLAQVDPRIVAVTAAMRDSTGLGPFAAAFPERCFDVGIAEAHAVCFAAGLATRGMRPVVAVYSSFMQRAYDQILHDVGLQGLPVVLVMDRGGIVGEDGPTHHGIYDFGFLRGVPGLAIMAPRDGNDLQHMLYSALRQPGPCAIRFPRGRVGRAGLDRELREVPPGKADWVRRGTSGPGILAVGNMVQPAAEAARLLEREGLDPSVLDARFVKPLDGAAIEELARRHGSILTVEEHILAGGFGSAVSEYLLNAGISRRVRMQCLALPDRPLPHGPADRLRQDAGLTPEGIAAAGRCLDAVGAERREPVTRAGEAVARGPGGSGGRGPE